MMNKKTIAFKEASKANQVLLDTHIKIRVKSQAERFLLHRFAHIYFMLALYHDAFPDKPKYVVFEDESRENVFVAREDYRDSIKQAVSYPGRKLTISEFEIMTVYRGENMLGLPETCHAVFVNERLEVVTKYGNYFRDRSPQEFEFAMRNKYFRGLIEMEVPLGFMVNKAAPNSTREGGFVYYPGERLPEFTRMFYKYMEGSSLDRIFRDRDPREYNWVLFEIAKLFSRLVQNKILFKDSHRLNNYFMEKIKGGQEVLRVLDSEFIIPKDFISTDELDDMLLMFLEEALKIGFIDWERMDDFLVTALGDLSRGEKIKNLLRRGGMASRPRQRDLFG